MQTAQVRQQYTRDGKPISLATCIETLYFEQTYNGQVYRTSLNNRLLVVGNKLNSVSKANISEALNKAQLPFYYITKIESDTASGLYRLDVSLYAIDTAVRATEVIDEIKTTINDNLDSLNSSIDKVNTKIDSFQDYNASTYLPLIGGKMSGGIVFGMKGGTEKIQELPGIGYNGNNLVFSCPSTGYISFWGSLSNEYGANTPGITWLKPTIQENGKVPVFNYANNQLMWKTYNAGSLSYTTADYKKYYILGITEESYNGRDIGETKYIEADGNIETNVYVSRTDVQEIDTSTYIPDVIQFRWLDTSELSYGFIAQDLEKHGLSYLMDKDDLNHWRVNYSAAISLVLGDLQKTKKIHEQRISKLESENKDLRKTLEKFEKRLEKLEKIK